MKLTPGRQTIGLVYRDRTDLGAALSLLTSIGAAVLCRSERRARRRAALGSGAG